MILFIINILLQLESFCTTSTKYQRSWIFKLIYVFIIYNLGWIYLISNWINLSIFKLHLIILNKKAFKGKNVKFNRS